MINWDKPDSEAIDGFTVAEIVEMVHDDVVTARCTECEAEYTVEPDAVRYNCSACGGKKTVTSPLRKLGLI